MDFAESDSVEVITRDYRILRWVDRVIPVAALS